MLTRAFLSSLHCPYCNSALRLEVDLSPGEEELDWGIVRCACYRYPILAGILVLQQYSPAFNTADRIVELLDAGDRIGALSYALSATSPVPSRSSPVLRVLERLERRGLVLAKQLREQQDASHRIIRNQTLCFRSAVQSLRPPIYADYLFYRHANTSFLAAVPLMSLFSPLQDGIVLDLACGVGHASYMLRHLFPQIKLVAADHDMVNLYLAKRFITPDPIYICINTEYPLPFADETFAGIWCLDGMHYIRSKVALAGELKRVTEEQGLWVFPHLHNALLENVSPGIPLPPEDYQRCFEEMNPHLFVESDILRAYADGKPLDLCVTPSEEDLRQAQVLSLIGSMRDIWHSYDGLCNLLAESGSLRLNPIYQTQVSESTVQFRVSWPSGILEAECGSVTDFVPQCGEVERGLFERLLKEQREERDFEQTKALVRSYVLVPLPKDYDLITIRNSA